MVISFKRLILTTGLSMLMLFSTHWALAGSAGVSVDTCPGGQCQGQRPITATSAYTVYLPLINRNYPIAEEFRGLWVTRFDWTGIGYTVTASNLDAIVSHA